jgi:membrane-associated phospholipid phosphatase
MTQDSRLRHLVAPPVQLPRTPPNPLPARWRRLSARYLGAQARHGRLLFGLQLLYVAVFVAVLLLGGNEWPAAPDLIVLGLLGFAVISARGLSFVRDWTPFLLLVLAYMALPGLSPGLEQRVHVGFPITVDRWLGGGLLPTTRLQAALWDPAQLHWYDYLAAALYLLHFLTPLVVAFAFWLWRRRLYWRFVSAYLLLMYAGFVTYLIYPMAPPWWASDLGRIPSVQPVLSLVHWHGIGNPVGVLTGTFHPDPVAAMPSMHAAFPVLVWLVLWRLFPRWGWATILYPLAMAFAVIYAGEHYLVDVLVGWTYALAAFAIVWWWGGRRNHPAPEPAEAD